MHRGLMSVVLAWRHGAAKGDTGDLAGIAELTDTTFGKLVFKASTPVLVEFWAPWAKQCILADPLLAEAAQQFGGSVHFVRLNVEDNPMAATVYGVRRLPLLILFRQGDELDRWSGALGPEQIVERVRAACEGGPAERGAESAS